MHSTLQLLAHRAPPATRKGRWQPYAHHQSTPNALSALARSPSQSSFNTPASSVSSTSSPHTTPLETTKPAPARSASAQSCGAKLTQKDPARAKHALSLMEQTVRTLCDIWQPHDIPAIFACPMTAQTAANNNESPLIASLPPHINFANKQLPSPITPSTLPLSPPTDPACQARVKPADSESDATGNLVPIRGFVTEVLRRSRTSGNVLQTALCYLGAVRAHVAELARKERDGEGVRGEPGSDERIVPGSEAEVAESIALALSSGLYGYTSCTSNTGATAGDPPNIRVADSAPPPIAIEQHPMKTAARTASAPADSAPPPIAIEQHPMKTAARTASAPAEPLSPDLPSPLLCPRRTFLAALILATKFTLDKCYSNRAWAKISGLHPREIGRCERALGDALQWRLWVGKEPVAAVEAVSAPAPAARTLARCQSETAILASQPFLVASEAPANAAPLKRSGGLRKAATLPAQAFAAAMPASAPPPPVPSTAPLGDLPYYHPLARARAPCGENVWMEQPQFACAPTDVASLPNGIVCGNGDNASIGQSLGDHAACTTNSTSGPAPPPFGSFVDASPTPSTPALTYSPSMSTSSYSPSMCSSSSTGDRTVQVPMIGEFEAAGCDAVHVGDALNGSKVFAAVGNKAFESIETSDAARNSRGPARYTNSASSARAWSSGTENHDLAGAGQVSVSADATHEHAAQFPGVASMGNSANIAALYQHSVAGLQDLAAIGGFTLPDGPFAVSNGAFAVPHDTLAVSDGAYAVSDAGFGHGDMDVHMQFHEYAAIEKEAPSLGFVPRSGFDVAMGVGEG
ncbi:uncharacterized protein SCHCODRAFT_02695316 [Schizophyllum commune H4-8]|uniref:Cyclin N-terminal domain-containing protein n=1 Tax=Schizophyllum commune (strain H4-8 / FGSC 9210) TaxID=578458 RepID=D8PW77_SCHCM|nr:uncharacterized protein SCHCODRAFT_02695316 [Schizophyllum commune H4-8]KAI5900059.1 hypothetical protein SCHCODRAFT_02695316 [Schizophyllum commune H4-8]